MKKYKSKFIEKSDADDLQKWFKEKIGKWVDIVSENAGSMSGNYKGKISGTDHNSVHIVLNTPFVFIGNFKEIKNINIGENSVTFYIKNANYSITVEK